MTNPMNGNRPMANTDATGAGKRGETARRTQAFGFGQELARHLVERGRMEEEDLEWVIDRYEEWLDCRDGFFCIWLFGEEEGLDEFWQDVFRLNPHLAKTDAYGRLLKRGVDLVTGFYEALCAHWNAVAAQA